MHIRRSHLIEATDLLEVGITSGRDFMTIVNQLDHVFGNEIPFFQRLQRAARVKGLEQAIEEMASSCRPHERMFLSVLRAAFQTTHRASDSIRCFRHLVWISERFEQKRRNLFFLPRFQASVILLVTGFLTIVFPLLFPDLFPSFLTVGRWELFLSGWSGIGLGIWAMVILGKKPQKWAEEMMNCVLFMHHLSLQLSLGRYFFGAWQGATSESGLSSRWLEKLRLPSMQVQSMSVMLEEISQTAPIFLKNFILGLSWQIESNPNLSAYIDECVSRKIEEFQLLWEASIQKMTSFCLFPLSMIVFPVPLFLLIGPRMLEWGGMG